MLGAIDLVRVEGDRVVRDVTVVLRRLRARRGGGAGGPRARGRARRQRLGPHLPDAQGRQDRGPLEAAAQDPRRPLDGLHAGRRRASRSAIHEDPTAAWALTIKGNTRRGRLRRHRGARPRRHRPGGGDAGDGGQGDAVQGVRRRRRLPALHRHQGRRRDRRVREGGRADVRRHQPRGHRGAALLRDRAPAARGARHPGLPRRPARHRDRRAGGAAQRAAGRRQAAGGHHASWWSARARPASRARRSCSPRASAT